MLIPVHHSKGWWLLVAIALAALFLAHAAALVFRILPAVSLWFPPAGIAVALTLWIGPWGALLAGLVSVLMAPAWGLHGGLQGLGLADAIEPLIAWWLYRRRWGGSLRLDSLHDAIAFTLSAPVVASAMSALVGTFGQMAIGRIPRDQVAQTIPYWWLGNALGIMAIAPLVLVIVVPLVQQVRDPTGADRSLPLFPTWHHRLEIVTILLLCMVTAALSVLHVEQSNFAFQQLSFLGFIPILWAATRFGVKGGVLTSSYCVISTLLAYVLIYGHALPTSDFPVQAEVLHVHKLSLLVQCGVGLWVGTAMSERTATQTALAVAQVRSIEYEARVRLNEQLMRLNDSLAEANLRLAQSNLEKDELIANNQLDRLKLQASETRLRTSLETMLDGVSLLSAIRNDRGQIVDFRFEFLNAAACAAYQMRPADTGERWGDRFSVNCCNDLFQAYVHVVETGEPLIREALVYGDRTYDIRAAKLEDGLIASWRDVSERQQAELALRQSEARFTRLAENAPGVIYQYCQRPQGDDVFTYISPGIREMYEVGPEAVLADSRLMWKCVHPDDLEGFVNSFSANDPTGQQWRYEWRVITPSGRIRWTQGLSRAERQPNGDLVWDGLLFDITDRKSAEAAIAQHAQTLDLASDSILIRDLDDRILYWNQGAEQQYGWTKTEAIGQVTHSLLQTQFATSLAAVQAGCLRTGHWEGELVHTRRNGTQVTVSSRWTVQRDENLTVTAILEINTDITARKQIETARAELLAREQVARQQAETASRLKDEFLAIVSHELRSPLNAMLGWSQLLRARQLPPVKVDQALEAIERNARVQTQLIEDLLDISRIVRGQVRLNMQPVVLKAVIEAAIDTMRPMAETKGINLESLFQNSQSLILSGDRDRLQQIVCNLLSNAIKFTPTGGRVEVRLEQVEASSATGTVVPSTALPLHVSSLAQLTVIDTGIGISSDFLPHVFEQFRQADSTPTRAQGGLGLGLAIVRNLIELHGGSIEVASPGLGLGATFTVRLPLMRVSSEGSSEPTVRAPAPSPPVIPLHILLVDDENDNLNFLKTALEQHGLSVTALASAADVLDLLPQLQPDVLVSDISMPDQDGYALIRQVRSLPSEQGGTIPAVALTAYAREEDRADAIAAGFQLHFSKPVELEELVAAIQSLMQLGQNAATR